MNLLRNQRSWLWTLLAATTVLAAGCSTTKNKTIPKPSHTAAAANDFPTAIQAGIPATTLQK